MTGIEGALTGIVTRDACAKISARGKPYVTLNLKIGEGDEAQFCNVLSFDVELIEAAKAGKIGRGVQIYAEGRLTVGMWTGDDGRSRVELKMIARFCRLPEIGRNRPKRPQKAKAQAAPSSSGPSSAPDLNDPIGFDLGCGENEYTPRRR